MIPVPEARQLILEKCMPSRTEDVDLLAAIGMVLSADVYSPIDTPPFDQSAVDGYAFSFSDWDQQSPLKIEGEIPAGHASHEKMKAHHTVRIFTGAPVPPGMETVVMQEKVEVHGKELHIKDPQLILGSNVRLKGSQTKAGTLALPKGHLLTPASISFLASLGIAIVQVYELPRVRIIVTGKELVLAGAILKAGMIYESNSAGLTAALKILGITPLSVEVIDDDERAIMRAINRTIDADILILTGGASVGDYDFVPSALEKCGVQKVFHKVKQKPGKPLYFGVENQTLIFGLPGNPAAVLSCFYQYIRPVIQRFAGKPHDPYFNLPLADAYKKKPGLTHFLKGKVEDGKVNILESQESYLMNSFAYANCLIELEEEKEVFVAGEMVKVLMIN